MVSQGCQQSRSKGRTLILPFLGTGRRGPWERGWVVRAVRVLRVVKVVRVARVVRVIRVARVVRVIRNGVLF